MVGAADELDAAVGQVAYAVAGAVQAPVGRSERIRNKAFGGKVGAAEVATRHALPADMQFAYDSRRYRFTARSEEHTSELQSLMRISYAVLCLKKNKPLFTYINTYN